MPLKIQTLVNLEALLNDGAAFSVYTILKVVPWPLPAALNMHHKEAGDANKRDTVHLYESVCLEDT